jgi:hypothetical protein
VFTSAGKQAEKKGVRPTEKRTIPTMHPWDYPRKITAHLMIISIDMWHESMMGIYRCMVRIVPTQFFPPTFGLFE